MKKITLIFVNLFVFYYFLNIRKVILIFLYKRRNCFFVISKKVTQKMYDCYSDIIKNDLIFITDLKSEVNEKNVKYYNSKINKEKGIY